MTELDGGRDGVTFDPELDGARLNHQARRVYGALSDRQWHSLHDLAARTADPEASISARIRDLRKPRFGQHDIERRRSIGAGRRGSWQYRLTGERAPLVEEPPDRQNPWQASAVAELDQLGPGDWEAEHSDADAILLRFVPADIATAYRRAAERCKFQYS